MLSVKVLAFAGLFFLHCFLVLNFYTTYIPKKVLGQKDVKQHKKQAVTQTVISGSAEQKRSFRQCSLRETHVSCKWKKEIPVKTGSLDISTGTQVIFLYK